MKKEQKVTVDDKLILSFEGKLPNNENVDIYHNNYCKLAKNVLHWMIFLTAISKKLIFLM